MHGLTMSFRLRLLVSLLTTAVIYNEIRASSPNPPSLIPTTTKGEVSTNQKQVRLSGYLQQDSRFISDNDYTAVFSVRRARFVTEASPQLYLRLKLMADFAGRSPNLYDACADIIFTPYLSLRLGKFKVPLGMERQQSRRNTFFIESGLSDNLVPNRDVGFSLNGRFFREWLIGSVGLFNGVRDRGIDNEDPDSYKDIALRLLVCPDLRILTSLSGKLVVGVALTSGKHKGNPVNPVLPEYKSFGQKIIFSYRDLLASEPVYADGTVRRIAPQGSLFTGALGIIWEQIWSSQKIRSGLGCKTLNHSGWQLEAIWFLGNEKAAFGDFTPQNPFNREQGSPGAFSICMRLGELRLDPDSFPGFADPQTSIRKAGEYAAGINWYPDRSLRIMLNYAYTAFRQHVDDLAFRSETSVLIRLQIAF